MMQFLFSLLFPKTCISCGREGTHCCEDCLFLLPQTPWTYPLSAGSHLSRLFSAVSYEEPLARLLIHKLKYPPFLKDLSLQCAYLMLSHIALAKSEEQLSNVLLIPIPLHKHRLKWRGYNHAQEIAKHVGETLSLPLLTQVLFKIKYTPPQTSLKRMQRLSNVKGAFVLRNAHLVAGQSILLIDDVYTTGATMEECARLLKKAGALRVLGAVVARG